jgi:hypothetical protein
MTAMNDAPDSTGENVEVVQRFLDVFADALERGARR